MGHMKASLASNHVYILLCLLDQVCRHDMIGEKRGSDEGRQLKLQLRREMIKASERRRRRFGELRSGRE